MKKMICSHKTPNRRRGAVAAMVMVCLVVLIGMTSLTIDVGMMYRARAEAQAAADAAALAAAMELAGGSVADMPAAIATARLVAAQYAGMNDVLGSNASVDTNGGNSATGDVVIGYLADPHDPTEVLSFADPNQFNTVRVRVTLDGSQNDTVPFFFAGIFGKTETTVEAEAYATMQLGSPNGFAPGGEAGNASLLPFALDEGIWQQLLAGTFTTGDNYSFDPDTGTVSPGSDGILEVNMYPGAGPVPLPPGNYGTVDIGSAGNSTADLARQITDGVSEDDIIDLGFEVTLEDGPFLLNGDTGISAGIKDELASIIGVPRTIVLFDSVSGNGNNAMYNITDFAGVRIMDVKLTGSKASKYVIVQPAFVEDGTGTFGPGGSGAGGGFMLRPVELIR